MASWLRGGKYVYHDPEGSTDDLVAHEIEDAPFDTAATRAEREARWAEREAPLTAAHATATTRTAASAAPAHRDPANGAQAEASEANGAADGAPTPAPSEPGGAEGTVRP